MGSTFFGLVDMDPLGSSMGLLGLPSLISYFIPFTPKFENLGTHKKSAMEIKLATTEGTHKPIQALKEEKAHKHW